jgi:hypothetical protein
MLTCTVIPDSNKHPGLTIAPESSVLYCILCAYGHNGTVIFDEVFYWVAL